MAIVEPKSMDEVIYFTNRTIGEGFAKVWVYRQHCTKCGKAKMGKPEDGKGHIRIRAKEYVCPSCNHTVEKAAYEETLIAQGTYTCPSCKKDGEVEALFKRKNIQGISTFRFPCKHCGANIDVTKKMKEKGSKGDSDD